MFTTGRAWWGILRWRRHGFFPHGASEVAREVRFTQRKQVRMEKVWQVQWWEWDREMNSCWCKIMPHLLFDKSFKKFPLTHRHAETHRPFWQYASFLSLQVENTLTHEPLGVYLKPPTRLGGIILVNSLFSYYSERVTSANIYTFWLQH